MIVGNIRAQGDIIDTLFVKWDSSVLLSDDAFHLGCNPLSARFQFSTIERPVDCLNVEQF